MERQRSERLENPILMHRSQVRSLELPYEACWVSTFLNGWLLMREFQHRSTMWASASQHLSILSQYEPMFSRRVVDLCSESPSSHSPETCGPAKLCLQISACKTGAAQAGYMWVSNLEGWGMCMDKHYLSTPSKYDGSVKNGFVRRCGRRWSPLILSRSLNMIMFPIDICQRGV